MTQSPTWILSGFGDEIDPDPTVQVAALQALGASYIEVRSAWGVNIVDLSTEQLDALALVLADRGMGVSAIASPIAARLSSFAESRKPQVLTSTTSAPA